MILLVRLLLGLHCLECGWDSIWDANLFLFSLYFFPVFPSLFKQVADSMHIDLERALGRVEKRIPKPFSTPLSPTASLFPSHLLSLSQSLYPSSHSSSSSFINFTLMLSRSPVVLSLPLSRPIETQSSSTIMATQNLYLDKAKPLCLCVHLARLCWGRAGIGPSWKTPSPFLVKEFFSYEVLIEDSFCLKKSSSGSQGWKAYLPAHRRSIFDSALYLYK